LTRGPPWLHTSLSRLTSTGNFRKEVFKAMKRIVGNFAFWVCVNLMSMAAILLVLDAFSVSPLKKII
jgi:hypothetical protein